VDPTTAIAVIVGGVLGGFVQGLSGFAFTMVAMALWAWTLDPQLAAATAVFGGMAGQIFAVVTIRRGFDFAVMLPLLAGAAIGIPIGVTILPHLDPDLFRTLLGAFLTICCPVMLAAGQFPRIEARGPVSDGVVGVVGGAMGGIGGFTGIFPTFWYTLRGFEKDRLRAVVQNFNLAALTVTMASYVATGIATARMLPAFAIVVPAMLLPWWLGSRVYVGIGPVTFRRVVLGLLTLAGIAMLISSLPRAIAHFA
jgi:uncharacterized membrane protein YfcA